MIYCEGGTGGCARSSPRSETDRRLTESESKSEAVHSLTSSEGKPPFLFAGQVRFKGCYVEALVKVISRCYINWLPRQVFSTDTWPDVLASSLSICQAGCRREGQTRTHA